MKMYENKMMIYSDDDLPLRKTPELYNLVILVRSVLYEGRKYNPQIFLHEYLYKS